MNGLNRVILIGHVGADLKSTLAPSGKRVLIVNIATNNAQKIDNSWVETTDWHRVTAYDKTAEYLEKFARKGDLLAVDCQLRPRRWEDAEGKSHHDVDIVIDRIAALHSRSTRTSEPTPKPLSDTELS